ncbi:penicillin acylase family protein [Sphingorhabdus arenilitoris]|uniref:Penicillin acylase family protein n=1 Tax=Sphingorhabdus arenilitoris TaxID=1490041 RepID=A0ABV8RFI5_9SPHN
MKWFKRIGGGLLILLCTVAAGLAFWEPFTVTAAAPPPERTYDVQIARDEFGVPHVYGQSDADTAYGLAYAHAEDDFPVLQEVVAMTRGRAGAMLGQDGAAIDFAAHMLNVRDTVDRKYKEIPADVRLVLDGYAAGLNHYADKHPDELRLSGLFPVNGKDIATGFVLRAPFFYGLNNTIEKLVKDEEPTDRPVEKLGKKAAMLSPTGSDPEMNGSNAWAVAPQRMSDGKTWLISNSHQPYEGGVAWYEAVIHSGEGLNMAGALFPGSPFVLLGHNRDLGWTNTVNQPDLIDVYKLEMNEAGTHYQIDGKWEKLDTKRIWLPVKMGPFTLPVPRQIYRSKHGPVIKNAKGAFAIRYAGMDNIKALEQYFRVQKATNHGEWEKAMQIGGTPATNFIYADKSGTIAYYYYALHPDRKPGFDYNRTLPGNRSDLIWTETRSWDAIPKIVNPRSGFVINANNTPFLAAGKGSELDRSDFPQEMGIEARTTNRIIRALELMPLNGKITPDALMAMKYDTGYSKVSFVGGWMQQLLSVNVSDDPQLQSAQDLLRQWDWNSDGNHKADTIGEAMVHMAARDAYNGRKLPDPRSSLKEVSDHLMTHFGRLDPPLGDVQRLIRGKVNMPAFGGTDTLRAATIWDPQDNGQMRVRHGDSFIMLVTWDSNGKVESRSLQPYGAATNRPASPHYTDQMQLFSQKRYKPVHFAWEDAVAQAKKSGKGVYRP